MQNYFLKPALFAGLLLITTALTACSEKTPQIEPNTASSTPLQITVYKSPTCDCCTDWEDHLRMEGFEVTSIERNNMNPIKEKFGVSRNLASCHTGIIDGYVIEGHVPASDIKRLLAKRPEITGLTAPGMPKMSPGMQPHGEAPKNYDVLSFDENGKTEIFTSYK
ncbi:MAG: DUF411 domain-containing protein [Gammaproteobacteria bacterium]|nr:DUF411 domain-containing protein [Gammaproteobacteria bacterium]